MDAIEMRLRLEADVELGSTGVFTGMGHGQGPSLMFLAVDLTIDHVPGAASARHAFGSSSCVGASTLGHEAWNHPVECKTVIEALLHQFDEIGSCVRSIGLEQLELDQACFRVHQGLGHGGASKTEV